MLSVFLDEVKGILHIRQKKAHLRMKVRILLLHVLCSLISKDLYFYIFLLNKAQTSVYLEALEDDHQGRLDERQHFKML